MAFSMLLRNSACRSRVISQQVMKLATQPFFAQRVAAASVPLKSLALDQTNSTPIINAVRSFRTTSPALAEHGHDHSKLWVIEKSVTAAMVPLIPLALMMPNKILDSILAILITAHSFWGLEAMVVEYVRVILFGEVIPKIAMAIVYFITAVTLGGLFYLNFNDIGMSRAFWKIWKNMQNTGTPPPGGSGPQSMIGPLTPYAMRTIVVLGAMATILTTTLRVWPGKDEPRIERGLEAIAVDYVRAAIFGPVIPKIAIALVYLISIATLGGLFYIISHDVGVSNAVRQFWSIKAKQA